MNSPKGATRQRVLNAMVTAAQNTGTFPTTRELAQALGISNGTAAYHVKALTAAGDIVRAHDDVANRMLNHVRRQVLDYGQTPTIPEIATVLKIGTTTATKTVAALVQDGHLAQGPGFPRRAITLRGSRFESAVVRLGTEIRREAATHGPTGALQAAAALVARLGAPAPTPNIYDRPTSAAEMVRWGGERLGRGVAAVEVETATAWPRTTTFKALHAAARSGMIEQVPEGWRSVAEDRTYSAALVLATALGNLPEPVRHPASEVLAAILRV